MHAYSALCTATVSTYDVGVAGIADFTTIAPVRLSTANGKLLLLLLLLTSWTVMFGYRLCCTIAATTEFTEDDRSTDTAGACNLSPKLAEIRRETEPLMADVALM